MGGSGEDAPPPPASNSDMQDNDLTFLGLLLFGVVLIAGLGALLALAPRKPPPAADLFGPSPPCQQSVAIGDSGSPMRNGLLASENSI